MIRGLLITIYAINNHVKKQNLTYRANPGFFLRGGAPPRNDVTDGEVKKKIKSEYVYTKKKASSKGGGGDAHPLHPPPRGIRSFDKRKAFFHWCMKDKADIIFSKKTYSTPEVENIWKSQ